MLLPELPFSAALARRARRRHAPGPGPDFTPTPPQRTLRAEWLLLLCCAWWVLVCNGPFFAGALVDESWQQPATWGLAATLLVGLVALHALVFAPLLFAGRLLRPLLALAALGAGSSGHFMSHYGTYMDPSMLRNALYTHWDEARELLGGSMLLDLALFAGVPLLLLARWRVRPQPMPRALLQRALFAALMAGVVLAATLAAFNPLANLMRNHRDLRYLINPAAPLWSLARAASGAGTSQAAPRRPIGTDAMPGEHFAARAAGSARPLVVVLVVGETARAANWGLSGYSRQTTPGLARLAAAGDALINVPGVTACGTNTETSLPCLFAPVGRRDYDETRIRGSQSLLHLVARAGVQVLWRDNQSGCKGVCDGLPHEHMQSLKPPGLCSNGQCLDEALLAGLPERLDAAHGTQLVVLHLIGSHGPAYFRRHPASNAPFQPACTSDDLRRCSPEEVVNAYDNTLHYTDTVLVRLTELLKAKQSRVDSAMLFVSDHGESLGEHGLYLHGLPWAVAPDVQKQVPMLLWRSAGLPAAAGVDWRCLRRRSDDRRSPVTHDHVFHTLLTLLDVRTQEHAPRWDLLDGCHRTATDASTASIAPAGVLR